MKMESRTVSLNDFFPDMLRLDFNPMQETLHASMLYNDYPSTAMTLSDDARLGFKLLFYLLGSRFALV